MKISDTQHQFNDELLNSHSGQLDMRLSLTVGGNEVGFLLYTVFEGEPSISMIEVKEKRKSYGTILVKKLQSLFPDEEIIWGLTTDEGEALRNSLNYKEVPTEYYDSFVKYKEYKNKLDYYEELADEIYSKSSLSDDDREKLRDIGDKLNALNDNIWDLEDIIHTEKPTKQIIQ